jgi:uncharacterized damage-inducible protein DinB
MSTETGLRELFIGWFDYYAARSTERFEGITDDEYLWEPAADCWSIRRVDGEWVSDFAWPEPEPAPVATIAWRLVHVCSNLSEHGLRAVAFEGGKADHVAPSEVPATAAEAAAALERAVSRWKGDLAAVTEVRLWEPMGPEAGDFAADTVAAFVEHIHDEFIHHTAEIALLRDLYRCR